MSTGLTIALAVVAGVLLLLVTLKSIYSRIGNNLQELVTSRFDKEEMLGATTRAIFFGVESEGGAQIRGNGALVLTRNELYFVRAAPMKEFTVPISSIRKVSMPRSFNGKSVFVPLLCVHYDAEDGEDSMAWALKNAKKWKDAIEQMIT